MGSIDIGFKLRDFEEKIKKLKDLARELNSLDTEGFESEVNSIKSNFLSPSKLPEVEKEISELKLMIAGRRKYKNKIEEKLKPTSILSLSKRKGQYDVNFNVYRDAHPVSEFIKVPSSNRKAVINEIDNLTTMINYLFGARGNLRGKKPELKDDAALSALSSLGDVMYGLFLPSQIQDYLSEVNNPLIIETNDTEIPWELMHDGENFLCLKNPVGRHIRARERARMNPFKRKYKEDKIKFLFVANPTEDLEATEDEVEFITSELNKLRNIEVEILKGKKATSIRVLAAIRSGNYDIIHYAGHAEFNTKSPDESGLLLAKKHILTAGEIKRVLRGRPIVFLNACSSGKEMMKEGEVSYTAEETEGLASSFILGGAIGFIGTLWPIYDKSASEFASVFYSHLIQGDAIGDALKKTRVQSKKSNDEDVTWASFVLYGNPVQRLIEQ